jgi:osmoprotectant transport system substrate-binding protein
MATALNDAAIDVAQVCTTQPEISSMNLVLLEDDQALQPAQNLVAVATQELVDAAPDDLGEILDPVTESLETEDLTELGVAININAEDIADVATAYLEDKGLI